MALVLGTPFLDIVYFFGIFYFVRPGNASRILAVTSQYVRLADHEKRGIDLIWSDCSIGATCICVRIVAKYSFGFNGVSTLK